METCDVSRPAKIWTIGHWNCTESDFLQPLREQQIELIADVRALPGSRRSPQFDQDEMPQWLARDEIDYVHLAELGGRRGRQPVDPMINAGWQNASFKNYADYTLSPAYETGIERLENLARTQRTLILCGEPMPWRCHRLLIANSLTARGWTVWHLVVGEIPRRHELGQWGATTAVEADGRLTYPALGGGDPSR